MAKVGEQVTFWEVDEKGKRHKRILTDEQLEERRAIFLALVQTFTSSTLSDYERGYLNKHAEQYHIKFGLGKHPMDPAAPAEIGIRAKRWRERWSAKTCTPYALLKYWDVFAEDDKPPETTIPGVFNEGSGIPGDLCYRQEKEERNGQ